MSYGKNSDPDFTTDEKVNLALKVALGRIQTDLTRNWYEEPADFTPKTPSENYRFNIPSYNDMKKYLLIDPDIDGDGTPKVTNITVDNVISLEVSTKKLSEIKSGFNSAALPLSVAVDAAAAAAAVSGADDADAVAATAAAALGGVLCRSEDSLSIPDERTYVDGTNDTQIIGLGPNMFTRYIYQKGVRDKDSPETVLRYLTGKNWNKTPASNDISEPANALLTYNGDGGDDSSTARFIEGINNARNATATSDSKTFYNDLKNLSVPINLIHPDNKDDLTKKHPFIKMYIQVPTYTSEPVTDGDNIAFHNPVIEKALGDAQGYLYRITAWSVLDTAWTIRTTDYSETLFFLNNPGLIVIYGQDDNVYDSLFSQKYAPMVSYLSYTGETFSDGIISQGETLPDEDEASDKDLFIDTSNNTIHRFDGVRDGWFAVGGTDTVANATRADTVTDPSQPEITSLGGDIGLTVTGDLSLNGIRVGWDRLAARFSMLPAEPSAFVSSPIFLLGSVTPPPSPTVFFNAGDGENSWITSGNVGIGTASPKAKLQVNGDFHIKGTNDAWGAVGKGLYFIFDNALASGYVQCGDFSGPTLADVQYYGLKFEALDYDFRSRDGIELVYMHQNGNVGFGTSDPKTRLDFGFAVGGSIRLGRENKYIWDDTTNNSIGRIPSSDDMTDMLSWYAGIHFINENSYDDAIAFTTYQNATGIGERLRISGNGNVGIGTDTPADTLDVSGNIRFSGKIFNGDGEFTGGDISPWTSGGGDIYYTSGGNVGIGTSSPGTDYKLEVNGNIKANKLFLTSTVLRPGTGPGSIILGHPTVGTAYGQYSVSAGYDNHTGDWSVAMGQGNRASGQYSFAVGFTNKPKSSMSVCLGRKNTVGVNANYSVAIGLENCVDTPASETINGCVALGHRAYVGGDIRFAVGVGSDGASSWITGSGRNNNKFVIDKDGNVGIGMNGPNHKLEVDGTVKATALMYGSTNVATELSLKAPLLNPTFTGAFEAGFGNNENQPPGKWAVAMGYYNTSWGDKSVAMGTANVPSGEYSFAAGYSNDAESHGGVALGSYCHVLLNAKNCVAIGFESAVVSPASGSIYGCVALGHRAYVGGDIRFAVGVGEGIATGTPAGVLGGPNNNKFVIDKFGKVGIGTNTPDYTLELRSGQVADNNFSNPASITAKWYGSLHCGSGGTADSGITIGRCNVNGNNTSTAHNNAIQSRTSGSAANLTINSFGGNVGIGADSPDAKLQVNGAFHIKGAPDDWDAPSKGIYMRFVSTYNKGFLQCRDRSTNPHVLYDFDFDAKNLVFKAGGLDRMTILENGNVGIGAPSSGYKLDVRGTIRATGTITGNISGSSGSCTGNASSASSASYSHYVRGFDDRYNNSGIPYGMRTKMGRWTVNGSGYSSSTFTELITLSNWGDSSAGYQVAIGCAKSGAQLRTYRAGNFNNVLNYYMNVDMGSSSSDLRIKKNIKIVPDNIALDLFRKIHSYQYDYINPDDDDDEHVGTSFGYLAQNVREHYEVATRLLTDVIPNEHRIIENPQWTEIHDNSNNKLFKLTIPDLKEPSGNTLYNFKFFYDVSMNIEEDLKELPIKVFDVKSLENEPTSFIFDKIKTLPKKVYIQGKYVDDFHRIFKKKLHSLHYAASKDIDRIQQAEKTKLATAEAEIVTLKNKVTSLETTAADLISRLTALESL